MFSFLANNQTNIRGNFNEKNNSDIIGGIDNISSSSTTISSSNNIHSSSASSCDRWFSSELHPNGTFTSPNYPEPYPTQIRCSYHFVGHGKQRVQVIFMDFDVHKVEDQHRE